FASFSSTDVRLRISNPEYSDFGPNTALMQSFAVGHNFPTEYPHFSGNRIRYHFLFYFQAGNLEFLGLDPAWSLNLLSITTIVAMLVIVMTLGEVLFNSRAVGRLGSLLFFFFGSLSYVPFLQKQASVRAAIEAITHQRDYLQTIFPYRGEAWGTWSQVTYLNQRHFATAIGIFLLVLLFLVIRYRAVAAKRAEARASANTTIAQRGESPHTGSMPVTEPGESPDTGGMPITEPGKSPDPGSMPVTVNQSALEDIREPQAEVPAVAAVTEPSPETRITREPFLATLPPFIFSGALLGLLPMFNSAVFLTAAAVLGFLFILFPLRLQMMTLAITAGLIALPQMLYLSTG